jgi:cytochrome c oxidase subunit IV
MATANASSAEHHDMHSHGRGHAAKYTLVWAVLVAFTIITVLTGRMHLPKWGLVVALLIATVKGTLVALYFMHLSEHHGANRLVFITSLVFVVLLISLTVSDVGTRFPLLVPAGSPHSDLPADDFLRKQLQEANQDAHGGERRH